MRATERRERPIIFSGEMVRAILDGRKTMTRRVMKPQPVLVDNGTTWDWPKIVRRLGGHDISAASWAANLRAKDIHLEELCPYGKPGDLLWVRETWCVADHDFAMENGEEIPTAWLFQYRAFDGIAEQSSFSKHCAWRNPPKGTERSIAQKFGTACGTFNEPGNKDPFRWRPSVHMPKWVSRVTLEVTNVHVERNASAGEWEWVVEFEPVQTQPQVTRTMIVAKKEEPTNV